MNTTKTRYPGERTDLACPERGCGASMELRSSKFGLFYGCARFPACNATHGAHPNGAPLGTPADRQTKLARIRTHDVFDPLWEDAPRMYDIRETEPGKRRRAEKRIQRAARGRAYRYVADRLGMDEADVHIGGADLDLCARIIRVCAKTSPEAIRAWAKEGAK